MSSHREAPATSKDPVADNTDTYAFVSPDEPDTVTLIANYLPLEAPFGGPNFFEFGDDVPYSIYIDNDGDGEPDITYEFNFETVVGNPNTFLYNTGPIDSISSPNWNRKQFYSVTRSRTAADRRCSASNLRLPAVQHRAGVDAELRGARRRGGALARGRADGVRRSAARGLLRRPRGDLRPRRPAAVREAAHRWDGELRGRQLDERVQRPLDRDPGAQARPDAAPAARTTGDARDAVIGVWAAASRAKASIREPGGVTGGVRALRSRSRGSGTRCSTR